MIKDKFKAVWVSYSSIKDYLNCPRAYFLNNVYRDPKTNHKISLINPHMALGQAVHEVIESLSVLPVEQRFLRPLSEKLETAWKKVKGKRGGFTDGDEENKFWEKGLEMLKQVTDDPGPLMNLAVKINKDLPYYWLSDEDDIILCGKIDWLEYLHDIDAVHIIDFKTGKYDEDEKSWQLPIYYLLASNCQKRRVVKASYWYLQKDKGLIGKPIKGMDKKKDELLKIAREIKLLRKINRFKCPQDGCRYCSPLEKIVAGKAEFVGINDFSQDVYVLNLEKDGEGESYIL